jgi:uncharacterized protein
MKSILIWIVKFYKLALSPYMGGQCRFYPSCSSYMIEAVEKKGAAKGLLMGVWRILRCNPLNKNSGYDPVK